MFTLETPDALPDLEPISFFCYKVLPPKPKEWRLQAANLNDVMKAIDQPGSNGAIPAFGCRLPRAQRSHGNSITGRAQISLHRQVRYG